MVSKKRLSYGFVGYQLPVIPKAPRSVRKRRPSKKLDDDQICAFELLAAVAGKLLLESESSASSNAGAPEGKEELANIKHVHVEDDKAVKSECLDQGSCVESSYIPEAVSQEHTFKNDSNKSILERTIGNIQTQVEGGSPNRDDPQKGSDDDRKKTELTVGNKYGLKGQIQEDVNNSALINSDSSVQSLPLYRDTTPVPCASFVKSRSNVKLGIRDDDENYFGCYRYNSTRLRTFRSTPRIAYRRIRKMVTSGHWKVAPKLKDCERSYCNDGMKSFYRNRKSMRGSERRGLEVPSKRRKICEHRFAMTYDQEVSSESISNSPEKGIKGNTITSNHEKKDPNVKFSIKSFKVPELYIEVPETETIGSLKKTVMEAVTAILGSGLRVGMVLQGKKVRDDNRTLQQAGISQSSNLDSLGFTLEPSFTKVPPSLSPKDDSLASASYITDEELARRPPSAIVEMGLATALSDPPSETKLEKHDESNHEQGMSLKNTNPVDQSTDEAISDSKALAVVPPANVEALASVPLNNKNKRSELSQRRTRRPFSVGEVEALVEAVEHLGTGRWRDVKMRAFEDADHRTYVDLKDKWKTLVHTASIAPQQRRGEPVPQDLLDRVLAAHGYWTQHQAKLHGKQHAEPLIVKM